MDTETHEWSPQQQYAINEVRDWLQDPQDPRQVFRLFGFAGTGKTTLAQHLVSEVPGQVLFAAFTGKAAMVLQSKGCWGASTIHSLIYIPRAKSEERLTELRQELAEEGDADRRRELALLIQEEEQNLNRPAFSLNLDSELRDASLLVLDEVSMVGSRIADDLLSFGTRILALGDPAQLPPVKDEGFFIRADPDVMLTEIHRQAEGNPIIDLATKVRVGQPLVYGEYGESRVIQFGTLSVHELAAHDQIIVGKNDTRHAINRKIRTEVHGYESHLPVAGDKLVCLRNNRESGLLNGSQWRVSDSEVIDEDRIRLWIHGVDETEPYVFDVVAWRHHFEDRVDEIKFYEAREAEAFDYGYAITCHKAQGSQWSRVAIVDQSSVFRDQSRKWLYTAITRAVDAVTIIS